MTCPEIRKLLDLSFGMSGPDPALEEHLNRCAECRGYWLRLTRLADEMPDDTQYSFDDAAIESMIDNVEEVIESRRVTEKSSGRSFRDYSYRNLMRLMPSAAALVLVVGVGVGGYFWGRSVPQVIEPSGYSAIVDPFVMDRELYDEPDEPTYDVLVSRFAGERPYDASETLLGDITEEEFNYLSESFHVGDIL